MEENRTADDQTSHSVRREKTKGIGKLEEDAEANHILALSTVKTKMPCNSNRNLTPTPTPITI